MLKRLLLLSLIACAGLVADPAPPTFFVEESHAVVVGRLVDIRVTHNGDEQQGTGRVIADAVIAGPVKRHDGFPLEWRYSSELARMCPPALDMKLLAGKRAIWFIELAPDGNLRAIPLAWSLEDMETISYYINLLSRFSPTPSPRVRAVLAVFADELRELALRTGHIKKRDDEPLDVRITGTTLTSSEAGVTLTAPDGGNWIEVTAGARPSRRWMVWVSGDGMRRYAVILSRDDAAASTADFAKRYAEEAKAGVASNGGMIHALRFQPATIPPAGGTRFQHVIKMKGRPPYYTFGYVTGAAVKVVLTSEGSEETEPEAFRQFVSGLELGHDKRTSE